MVQWISLQLSMQYCSYQIATKMQKLTTITNYTIIFQVCLPVYHSTTATGYMHVHYCAESRIMDYAFHSINCHKWLELFCDFYLWFTVFG